MTKLTELEKHRRSFLKYLAASPVLAAGAKSALAATTGEMVLPVRPADPMVWWPHDPNYHVERPEDALDVFELEAVAHKNMPPAHFGFVTAGADDDGGVRANRLDIAKFALRGKRLRDVRKVDQSVQIFGSTYASPFFFCPVGGDHLAHADGVLGAARAAGRANTAQMISTAASATISEVNAARNASPAFFQLYNQANWEATKILITNAEKQGAEAMAVTVDTTSARKDTQFERSKRSDSRLCATCHIIADPKRPKNPSGLFERAPQLKEVTPEMWEAGRKNSTPLTWELLKRMRDITKMEILLKGIMHPEDAAMAVKYGYGIHISNHGARNEDTSASTIGALPDIVSIAKGKVPIFIDGGFRRGMDIVKAIAMGATMVGFGRPWVWGLGAFGEAGVERVIQIIQAEITAAMQQVGAANLKELTPNLVYKSL